MSREKGRPALSEDGSKQFSMRLPTSIVDRIERLHESDYPMLNRSDVIRILLDEALKARKIK